MADSKKHSNDANSSEDQQKGQQEFAFKDGSDRKSRIWIFGVLLLIGGAIGLGLYWNQSLRVASIEIRGTELSDPETIRSHAAYTVGLKRDSVSMMQVIDSVETVDFVRSASVSINLNGTLELEIEEREPLALLADRTPKMWVDRDGVVLPLRLGRNLNLPLLYGFNNTDTDTLNSEAFRRVSDFLTTAQTDAFTWSTLSELTYDAERGVVAVSGEESMRLIFGKQEFERKMKYWKAYYSQVLKYKKTPQHREVDLRYDGQIVTRN